MFRLSSEELQRRRAEKLIQSTEEIFEALGFHDLVEPEVKVEMSTAFYEVSSNTTLLSTLRVRREGV